MKATRLTYVLITFILFSPQVKAQTGDEPIALSYRSIAAGVGFASSYDTYLSPIDYEGSVFTFTFEAINPMKVINSRGLRQHLLAINFASTQNPAENANEYVVSLDYTFGMFYRFKLPVKDLQLFAGANVNALLGGIIKSYGGNNPATPKVNLNLGLSAMAVYPLKVKNTPLILRYQVNMPVFGLMYAHQFGESYYEIDLGGYKNLCHFASFHNQFLIKNDLSAELVLNPYTLKVAYENNYYGTRIHDLKTRIKYNTLYIGMSWNFQLVSPNKINKERYRTIFDS
jgi:hypothetical protein